MATVTRDAAAATIEGTGSLDELYPALADARMTAGWHKKRASLWDAPRTEFRPRHWRYADARAALDRAGEWIGTELAERRNLLVFNPVGDNDYATTRTLVAAYQMIKPGEHARAHRHTPNALRLVLDAEPGIYTIVDGVKLPMMPGDVALTPGWAWHSHYNEGDANGYWIDVLDVPLVHLLEPMFFEPHPDGFQQATSEPAESPLAFPIAWTRRALAACAPDAAGIRRLLLPKETMVTMDLWFLGLPAGAATPRQRTTASNILSVVEGSGTARIGDLTAEWERGDILAVPSWTPFSLAAEESALIFQVTDEPVLDRLGFLRKEG